MHSPFLYTLLLLFFTTLPVGSAAPPVLDRWTAFGDSFSAGIGAGTGFSDSGSCRRRSGAYPVQLNVSPQLSANPNHEFDFLACSGAVMNDVKTGQLDAFKVLSTYSQDLATITIGGNDVGFADALEACILQARKSEGDCEPQLEASERMIDDSLENLASTYTAILKSVDDAGGDLGFSLIVIGYPIFFNEATTQCNQASFGFWTYSPNRPLLTIEKRKRINGLVKRMNDQIEAAVTQANRIAGYNRVRFVDADSKFDGHRFCEATVTEPDNSIQQTWFFLMLGDDSPAASPIDGDPVDISPEECSAILNGPFPRFGDAWGRYMMCAVTEGISEGRTLAPWINSTNSDFGPYPEMWAKFFHPKTRGHSAIMEAIAENIEAHPRIPGSQLALVLIMFDGTSAEFETFISTLNKQSQGTKYEQNGLNIRGYATHLGLTYAKTVRLYPGVLGISYGDSALSVLPEETRFAKRDNGSFVKKSPRAWHRSDDNSTSIAKRQTTETELYLQTALFMSTESLHLRIISNPPAFNDVAYYQYPGYLYDPAGGAGVNVYVLDTGMLVHHPEFTHRPITKRYIARGLDSYMTDDSGHGTCMASLVGGKIVGVAKAANIIPVRWEAGAKGGTQRADRLFESLLWILYDVITSGKQGQAVINYSAGVAIGQWGHPEETDLPVDSQTHTDPWSHFLPLLEEQGIIIVTSVGNEGNSETAAPREVEFFTPRRYAMSGRVGEDTLIVAGATDSQDNRWSKSNDYPSIITNYAPGEKVMCASLSTAPADRLQEDSGSSIAAAITSGLVATFLGRMDLQDKLGPPDGLPARMKLLVKEIADYSSDTEIIPNTEKVLRTYNYIRCDEPEFPFTQAKIKRQETFARRVHVTTDRKPQPIISSPKHLHLAME